MDERLARPAFTVVALLVLGAWALAQTQGSRPTAAGGPQGPTRIHITGENPGIRLRDRQGGPILAQINFWRVAWSPVGTGHVCFVTTGDGRGLNDLRLALTDNERLADYVTHDTMAKLVPDFANPPYKAVRATFGFSGDSLNERTETCNSDRYKVAATWRGLSDGNYGEMRPPNGFLMQFIIMIANEGEIRINGKKLPGTVQPTTPGDIPNAYLAFAETWRK